MSNNCKYCISSPSPNEAAPTQFYVWVKQLAVFVLLVQYLFAPLVWKQPEEWQLLRLIFLKIYCKVDEIMQFIEHSARLTLFDYRMTTKSQNIDRRYSRKLRSRMFSQYRKVSSVASSISSNVNTFLKRKKCVFCLFPVKKKLYFKAKNTHFLQFRSPRLPPPLFRKKSLKKIKKGH